MQRQGGAGRAPPRDGSAGTSGGCGGGDSSDRISALPDDVCCLILSFLKAWEAVRTSTLSGRWRDLWATAPRLDIRHPCACDARADQERYGKFVKNLLLRRRAPLDKLRLHWGHGGDANTWISYAVRHEATVIELSGKNHHKKPEPEYTSFISESDKPSILKLTHVALDSRILRGLCSTSASLEELELKNCHIYGYEIQSALLKCLTMINCMTPSGLLVDAPNLVLLRSSRPYSVVPRIENSRVTSDSHHHACVMVFVVSGHWKMTRTTMMVASHMLMLLALMIVNLIMMMMIDLQVLVLRTLMVSMILTSALQVLVLRTLMVSMILTSLNLVPTMILSTMILSSLDLMIRRVMILKNTMAVLCIRVRMVMMVPVITVVETSGAMLVRFMVAMIFFMASQMLEKWTC